MRVFKFGGASVKNADAVRNVASILELFQSEKLVVVVSAMGKTTNALESILQSYWDQNNEVVVKIDALQDFHNEIISDLFNGNGSEIQSTIDRIFSDLKEKCLQSHSENYNYEYDQIVSLGEVISTKIIAAYLSDQGKQANWSDARKLVRTNHTYREAKIDWNKTTELIQKSVNTVFESGANIAVTQGFIGHTEEGHTTTLGREGSDFTASIFAYCLDAEDVTIWKDVPGMLNADPKYFDNTILLEKISFREAVELAYFGASVIHPRTIQPLKRKNIPLHIKSFVDPQATGSIIQSSELFDAEIPSFIFKMDQVLISLSPRDFSFVIEENLEDIFAYLNNAGIRMNIMQNSAVSFSFCVDRNKVNLEALIQHFQDEYVVKYNEQLELVTIRHFDDPTIERVTVNKKVIMEQKTRQTARLVMQDLSLLS